MFTFPVLGGAATVSATALAIAKLQVPYAPILSGLANVLTMRHGRINLVVLTPLTENLPGPTASKPGDTYVCSHSWVAVRSSRGYRAVASMR